MAIKELFNDARPQVLFDPRASQRIDPRFKFTRDSAGTRVAEDGYITSVGNSIPRIDFDPISGDVNGMLIEEQRTNAVTNSALGNLIQNDGATVTTITSITTPDGTTGPCRNVLMPSSTTGGYCRVGGSISIVQGQKYTVSMFVRNPNGHAFEQSAGGANLGIHLFRTGTGQNANVGFGSSAMYKKDYANGWRRYAATFPAIATTTVDGFFSITLNSSTYLGWEFQLWGFQIEEGDTATSYIPTSGSQVTRNADLLSIEAPLPATGSIYIDARSLSGDIDTTLLSAAPASPSTDKLALAIRQPASLYNSKTLVYEVNGAFKPTLPFPVPGVTRERNLITYGANNYHYRSDSARYTPSSSSSVPANMTRLGIGHDVTDPTKGFNGYINAVYLWAGEITPTVAEALVRGDVDPKDADAGVFTPAAGSLAFVFNTQGTATDGDTVVQLPLRGSTNNVKVDWGDNTGSSLIGAAASVTVDHTYTAAGIYPVQITADDDGTNSGLENLQFFGNSPADLVRVLQWGGSTTFQPTTMYRIFRDCTQMDFETAARTNLPDTSGCSDWREAFYNCSSLSGSFPSFNFSAATTFASAWQGCSSLAAFPAVGDQTQNVTNFGSAWYNCSSLTSFPLIDTSAGISFYRAWYNCSSLTSFPLIDTSAATSLREAWRECSSLTSFPLINTSSCTDFFQAWFRCSSLTSFPLIDTSSATNIYNAWAECPNLTSFPLIDTSSVTSFGRPWRFCSSLTSFPLINTSAGTNFSATWDACSSLTSFPLIDTSSATVLQQAWRDCSSLTSFPLINTSSCTNFLETWDGCSSLTSFPLIDTSSGTYFQQAWENCSSLTDFPANFFDSWSPASVANQCFYRTWDGCSSLTPASVVNILDSIAVSGQSAPTGTDPGDRYITIDWDGTGDPATDAAAAITTLKSRNWEIYLNGVLQ